GAVVATAGVVWFVRRRRRQRAVPDCVTRWNETLHAYLEALELQSLDVGLVESVLASLDDLQGYSEDGTVIIDLTTGQFVSLLEMLVDYTERLAEANAVAGTTGLHLAPVRDSGTVAEIRRHLEAQRSILSEAA